MTPNNKQAPISCKKIQPIINNLLSKYTDSIVNIVTTPNEKIQLNYPIISTPDENIDLLLLCNCKKTILSRSTFSFISLFFGEHTEVYVPQWGQIAAAGMGTKYDKHDYITYFY